MPPVVHVEWLNRNGVRKYPLSEEATGWDVTGSFRLPDNFIVDMVLPVHSTMNLDVSKFHVLRVAVFGTGVSMTIGHNGAPVATISVPAATFTRNKTYFLQGIGEFTDVLGKVVIGTLDTILDSAGSYEFDIAGGRIEASVVIPDIRGVASVCIVEDDVCGPLIQGDIAFEAGRNVRLVRSEFGDVTVLTIDAIDGEGTIADCVCDGDIAERPGIQSISGVGPDKDGNVELEGDDCLEVVPLAAENKLRVRDNCSKPCCGCLELQALRDDQERVRDEVLTMKNLASRLEGVISAMQSIVAASA